MPKVSFPWQRSRASRSCDIKTESSASLGNACITKGTELSHEGESSWQSFCNSYWDCGFSLYTACCRVKLEVGLFFFPDSWLVLGIADIVDMAQICIRKWNIVNFTIVYIPLSIVTPTNCEPYSHSNIHVCSILLYALVWYVSHTLTQIPTLTLTHTHTHTHTLTHPHSELKGSTLSSRLHKLGHNFTAPSKTRILRQIAEVFV